jgi:hypothetical protein
MSAEEPTPHADEDISYGGVCPVCGDEFTDGFDDLEEDQSVEDVRVCVVELENGEADALFHLPDDQTPPGELPEHFVVAEIGDVQITGPPQTFEAGAEEDLEEIESPGAVENARVVSYE